MVESDIVKKYPFVSNVPLPDRAVIDVPYYDSLDMKFKMPTNNLTHSFVYAIPVQGVYWSKQIVDQTTDLYCPLIYSLINNYSYLDICSIVFALTNDIFNMSVVLDKYFFYNSIFKEKKDPSISNYLMTDLEYFFGLVRSHYDNLHSIIMNLYFKNTKNKLKDSYSSLVEKNKERLLEDYNLPESVIKFYLDSKDVFLTCREIRDNIYHRGHDVPTIFCSDDGFCISKNFNDSITQSIVKLNLWDMEHEKINGLISILPILSYLTKNCIEIMNNLDVSLNELYPKPPNISEKYKIFLRGSYTQHLLKLDYYSKKHWL